MVWVVAGLGTVVLSVVTSTVPDLMTLVSVSKQARRGRVAPVVAVGVALPRKALVVMLARGLVVGMLATMLEDASGFPKRRWLPERQHECA